MFLEKLQEIYSILLARKDKELKKNNYKALFPLFFEASVFLYMIVNFDKYASGVLKNSHMRKSNGSEKRAELLAEFINYYESESHQDIRNICKFYRAPKNLKEAILCEYPFEKMSYLEMVQKLFDTNFLNEIDLFVTEFYSQEETRISCCIPYSLFQEVPTNRNYEYWNLLQARGFLNLVTDMYLNYKAEHGYENRLAQTLYNFITIEFSNYYYMFYRNDGSTNRGTYTQHYYDERRRFLSMFFGNSDRGLEIIAYSFALPIKAFRSFLWNMNVDLQDLESYIRRMGDKQFATLKNAYYLICVDSMPELHPACTKGWKHIFHRPSLQEIKNEELYDESERFKKNWAVVKNEVGLDMGFTMYRGTKDDTVNTNAKYLSKKDHKNFKEKGFSEFYINPDGFYGICTRKIFGNYLWGDFDEQEVSGWVCPRFWTTFLLYFTLLVVSPACIGLLLLGGIENTKVIVWLSIFGSLFPLLLFAYTLKYLILKVVNFLLYLICGTDEKVKEFIDLSVEKVQEINDTKYGPKTLYLFAKTIWCTLLLSCFSYAYEPILAVSFTVVVDYFVSSYLKKGAYIPLSNLKYAKYAIFLLVSAHLIFVWETIFDISRFLFDFFLNYYAYLVSLSMLIVPAFIVVGISKKYFEVQDKYVVEKSSIEYSYVDSLFDKLVMVVIFSFFAIFLGELIFFVKFSDLSLLKDGLYTISIFIGINLLLFSPSLFLFRRPVVLEYEKTQYNRGKSIVNSYVSGKRVIFAISNNKWLFDKKEQFIDYYNLFDSFSPDNGPKFKRLFVKYINRLDDGFLFEVRCLRTILNERQRAFSFKHIKKLVNSQMTAREVVDYFDKLEAIQNKIFKKIEIVYDFSAMIYKGICYPFIWIWSIVCMFFGAIVDLYEFVIDTFHKICPYSNASERI